MDLFLRSKRWPEGIAECYAPVHKVSILPKDIVVLIRFALHQGWDPYKDTGRLYELTGDLELSDYVLGNPVIEERTWADRLVLGDS